MATVSPIYTTKGLGVSDGAEQDQWDFSIRASMDNQTIESYTDIHPAQPTSHPNLDELERSTDNGTPKSSKSKDKADVNYLSPYKQGLKPDISGSRSVSEPDSLIDLYKQRNSTREKSTDSPTPSPRHIGVMNYAIDAEAENKDDDAEQSRWIHKDKLAEIERREMEAAGISPPPARSKSRSRRARSPETITNDVSSQDEEPLPTQRSKRRRVRPPPEHVQEEKEEYEGEEQTEGNAFDLRTPEEIAADTSTGRTTPLVYRQQAPRSSSSRIPLPRSSPMPLPQEHPERNTPLPRKRGASGNWNAEDSIVYNRSRSRGNSVGSQVLLDDIDTATHGQEGSPPPSSGSPTKSRTTSNSKHFRKTSTSTPTNSKARSTSATQASTRSPSTSAARPKSRSGLEPRPPTAINRPEGDAPWLKDMYKPDPMLPPEQQLLPTHAKRLQEEARRQEQWEQAQRDGEARKQARTDGFQDTGRDEDGNDQTQPLQREFSPLAEYTTNGLQPTTENSYNGATTAAGGRSVDQRDRNHHRNSGSEWPLTRTTGEPLPESMNSGGMPVTADRIGDAGYSAVPGMRLGNEDTSASYRATVTSPGAKGKVAKDPFEKERLARMEGEMPGEEKGEGRKKKKKKSGGCCGCVVM